MTETSHSRAAELLAFAIENRVAIKLRVEQEPGAVLHLRVQQGEETTNWAHAIEHDRSLAQAIETLLGEVLAMLPGAAPGSALVAAPVDIAA